MCRHLLLSVAVLGSLLLCARAARADSLECDGRWVSPGDSKVDLLGKCGEPALREERIEERQSLLTGKSAQAGEARKVTEVIEVWTYDFGPQRFVQYVTLSGGKVHAVASGPYGSARAARRMASKATVPLATCDALRAFRVGDRSSEVLRLCGEPATREAKQVEVTQVAADQNGNTVATGSATEVVETWTYNFGPSSFQRRLVIKNGVVADVDTGGYGYAR